VIPRERGDGSPLAEINDKELKSIMTKNGKYFTFLFSFSKKSRIYIKRFEVSKRLLQNGLLSISVFGLLSFFGFGIFGVFGSNSLDGVNLAGVIPTQVQATFSAQTPVKDGIDYSRPDVSADYSRNAGGPVDTEDSDEDNSIEKQVLEIFRTSNPANIPNVWAHLGKINNEFGFRRNPFGGRTYEFHAGMDIDGERGDPVQAPANGVVTKAGWQGGYGNMIEIEHGNGLISRYGHLSRIEVEVGQQISRGQTMGEVGSTGRSTGPHLHYELRLNEKPINPRHFLPQEPAEVRKLNG
jgi:murein DD-endopeptidase MepM/ murein hydrolase activator NlpD